MRPTESAMRWRRYRRGGRESALILSTPVLSLSKGMSEHIQSSPPPLCHPRRLSPTLVPDLIGDPVKEWIQSSKGSRVFLWFFLRLSSSASSFLSSSPSSFLSSSPSPPLSSSTLVIEDPVSLPFPSHMPQKPRLDSCFRRNDRNGASRNDRRGAGMTASDCRSLFSCQYPVCHPRHLSPTPVPDLIGDPVKNGSSQGIQSLSLSL